VSCRRVINVINSSEWPKIIFFFFLGKNLIELTLSQNMDLNQVALIIDLSFQFDLPLKLSHMPLLI